MYGNSHSKRSANLICMHNGNYIYSFIRNTWSTAVGKFEKGLYVFTNLSCPKTCHRPIIGLGTILLLCLFSELQKYLLGLEPRINFHG
jgi:hypothetical protein